MSSVTKGKRNTKSSLYIKTILTRNVILPFHMLGANMEEILFENISNQTEGKCIIEGFIKPGSIKLLNHTAGRVTDNGCSFKIIFEAYICRPVEGMKFKCLVKNITKAGIRAEREGKLSPVIVFIARDHNYNNKYFSTVKENEKILVKVVGTRYELNDKYISVLAELIETKKKKKIKI